MGKEQRILRTAVGDRNSQKGEIMANAQFKVNTDKCTGCGLCLAVCPGNMINGDVLTMGDGQPVMVNQSKFGWDGCWRCLHCLAVCPEGALSILGLSPEEVPPKPDPHTAEELAKLMQFRRSCRDFRKEEVDTETIDEILDAVCAVPTGGNNQRLQFTVVYTRDAMKKVYGAVFGNDRQMSFLDEGGDEDDLSALRIYDAPHLFIAHKEASERFADGDVVEINMATAYFELLANAKGLGTIVSTYSAELLSKSREVRKLLNIPEDHRFMTVVGFGYPKYKYARGVRKSKPVYKLR